MLIDLRFVGGDNYLMELPPTDRLSSIYFISMEDCGALQIWQVLTNLLKPDGRPVCMFSRELRTQGHYLHEVVEADRWHLLTRRGYTFGIFWDIEPLLLKPELNETKKILLVRDPRDVVLAVYRAAQISGGPVGELKSDGEAALDFVQSQRVERIARRYRRFADFCRRADNVMVIRYDDVQGDWPALVADLIGQLALGMPPEAASAIAASAATSVSPSNAHAPRPSGGFRKQFDTETIASIEDKFAEAMAYFGYVPEATLPAAFLANQGEFLRAVAARLSRGEARPPAAPTYVQSVGERIHGEGSEPTRSQALERAKAHVTGEKVRWVPPRVPLFEPDPDLFTRLRPNAAGEQKVLGRTIVQEVDAFGGRPVIGQPEVGAKTLAAYGCSCTYGMAVNAEETFCSQLQGMFPAWRVENHGVSGYSSVQNLIQLRRNSRWAAADYVTFCWIDNHLMRNVGDPSWLQNVMEGAIRNGGAADQALRPYPRGFLDEDGGLILGSFKFPRWDLVGIDLADQRPDPYYKDLVQFAVFRSAAELVKENSGHFFVTTLRGSPSSTLQRMLAEYNIPVVDASVDRQEFSCLPDDPHPNAPGHRIYAEKIRDYLVELSV
jgi:hypothetical protein